LYLIYVLIKESCPNVRLTLWNCPYRHESEWAGIEPTMFGFAYANEPHKTSVPTSH